jgi:hypothetical protein
MWADSLAHTRRVDWKELAEVLNRPQFLQLRKVSVFLTTKHDSGADSKTWVCKEMSGLASSRGLCLSVSTYG